MSLPRVYRDPVHGQLKFERLRLSDAFPHQALAGETGWNKLSNRQIGWLIPNLIDTVDFQRLRHIRQNGLTNLVFHGTEHSRFSHSMGVAYLAREMYDRIAYNMDAPIDDDRRLATVAAGLLHDIGHGPFSHTMEEILKMIPGGPKFHHEQMTRRIIEEDTPVNRILLQVDDGFPSRVATYIDKTKRKPAEDHWAFRIISSQLDADRLDYLLRDARHAGLRGHGFDLERLLDMLGALGNRYIGIDRGALEAVEAYLIMLEQAYRAIYFHRAVRSATHLLTSILSRAIALYRSGDGNIFPSGRISPLHSLIDQGQDIELEKYSRLGEFQVWTFIEEWQEHPDPVLSDLCKRLMTRRVFKSIDLEVSMPILWQTGSGREQTEERIKEAVLKKLTFCDSETVNLYVIYDHPDRVSYKSYDWKPEKPDESIWLLGKGKQPRPLESDSESRIITGLKEERRFPRILFPSEVSEEVREMVKEAEAEGRG